jgi:hypothetical protein
MKKIGILALAVVLALGSLGIGFALWSETLYIEGTVATGELDADLTIIDYWEDGDVKDVAWAEASVVGKTLYWTVYNAYPNVFYWLVFDIHNSGTIPMHVCGFNYDMSNVGPGVILYYCGPSPLQVHPGESVTSCVVVELTNDVAQGSTHTFTFEYVNVQYNESCPAVDLPFG